MELVYINGIFNDIFLFNFYLLSVILLSKDYSFGDFFFKLSLRLSVIVVTDANFFTSF